MSTVKPLVLTAVLLVSASAGVAHAAPVVYTLRTVADGGLGQFKFYEARVTIRMRGDTRNVRVEQSSNGDTIYINRGGNATVTVQLGDRTSFARFGYGEIYVRYDATTGILGFGSASSPTYPVALGCANDFNIGTYIRDCVQGTAGLTGDAASDSTSSLDSGIVNALADPTATSFLSTATLALPVSLSKSTLFTGIAHTCPGNYTFSVSTSYADVVELGHCPSAATLRTDKGPFYLQDSLGFSNVADVDGLPGNFSVDHYANVGSLQVEVLNYDE
jgi:hypothetical protein